MGRSYASESLITLPRLNAAEAVVLSKQLLTMADYEASKLKGKELPPAIGRSKGRLAAAHNALDVATRPSSNDVDTQAKRRSDWTIDNAWSATFDWLTGWCKLPAEKNPHLEESVSLRELIFPDALSFTKLPYKVEWRESQSRLDAIVENGYEPTFKKLGGGVFLTHLREAHAAYGEALHITVPKPAPAALGDVKTAFLAVLDALRDYVKRVASYGDPDVPGSEELGEALLLPLVEWDAKPVDSIREATLPGQATPPEADKPVAEVNRAEPPR